jgi:hypothetical protein
MVESLANILAVQLIRHTLASRRLAGRTDGTLPPEVESGGRLSWGILTIV